MLGIPVSRVIDSDNFDRPGSEFLTQVRRMLCFDDSDPVTNSQRQLLDHMPRKIALSPVPLLMARRNTLFLKKATVRNRMISEQAGLGQLMMA